MVGSSPRLSLCLIFKDEAAFLKECLESVMPIVDECVLVDSGSLDGSEKIIHELQKTQPKIRYFLRPWPGDFADQKNYAIEQATGDWILFLDADERLAQTDHATLLSAIGNKEIFAYDLPIRNYTNDFTEFGYQVSSDHPLASGFVLTHLHRLFRRHSKIRYEGILHERIEPSLARMQASMLPLSVTIHHLGPLKAKNLQLEEKRYKFYEELGRRKVFSQPQDAQSHWELGVILQKQRKLLEAEKEFRCASELQPEVEEFAAYYSLSLFQQAKWNELRGLHSPHRRAQMFTLLALAQTDPKKIDELDAYRSEIAQVALFIFELSLMHHRHDRLEKDRTQANMLFERTGLVEFLEGARKRKDGQLDEARQLLGISKEKGCLFADRELAALSG